MNTLGFSDKEEATLAVLILDAAVVKSSEIEGELLNYEQVRSSIARRLVNNANLLFKLQNIQMLRAKLRIMRVIRSNDDQSIRSIFRNQVFVPLHALHIQVGSRLVQQQDGRIRTNGKCQFEPLFHT